MVISDISGKPKRLAIYSSHSEFLWAIRSNHSLYPIRAQVIRIRDGAQLAQIVGLEFLPLPAGNANHVGAYIVNLWPEANGLLEY
jgi:hypothetical protein